MTSENDIRCFVILLLATMVCLLHSPAGQAFTLHYESYEKDGVNGVDGLAGATSSAIVSDGTYLYVASYVDDAISVFHRDTESGLLTFIETKKNGAGGVSGINAPGTVALSPDEEFVYVTGTVSDAIAVFSRDDLTGQLSYVGSVSDGANGVDGLDFALAVVVSPDGQHVYANGQLDHAIAVFFRSSSTGELTFVQAIKEGDVGIDGLDYVTYVAISPDGSHIYATTNLYNNVFVFSRNTTTGILSFVEKEQDGVDGVEGIDGGSSVTVSPDGRHVYVTGADDDSVAVFSRDASTGEIDFVEFEKDGVNGVEGIGGAKSVTVDPTGSFVYVTGYNDNSFAAFSRNKSTGELTFLKAAVTNVQGMFALYGASSATVSPDGSHVYVTTMSNHSVNVYTPGYTISEVNSILKQWDVDGDNAVGLADAINALKVSTNQ